MLVGERIPHESARDYALRTIILNIVKMELAPGSKISDHEIATELGISRTPVREALIELAKYGLVEMYPQKGSIIAPVSYRMIQEATSTRDALECAVVTKCCSVEDPAVFKKLHENIALMRVYTAINEFDKYNLLDEEFHREMFTIAGMPMAYEFLSKLKIHHHRMVVFSYVEGNERNIEKDHQAILDAILEHNEEKAVYAMKRHLNLHRLTKEEILKVCPDCVMD